MQRILARDFTPNFSVGLMAKDLAYAIGEAEPESGKLAMTSAANAIFDAGIEHGLEAKDLCSIIELFRERSARLEPRSARQSST